MVKFLGYVILRYFGCDYNGAQDHSVHYPSMEVTSLIIVAN